MSDIEDGKMPHRWTKTRPAAPGWYWYRDNSQVVVVSVVEGKESARLVLVDDRGPRYVDDLNVEWAGPIAEPIE